MSTCRPVFDRRMCRPTSADCEGLGVMAPVDAEDANVVILDRFDLDPVAKLPVAAESNVACASLGLLLGLGRPAPPETHWLAGFDTLLDLDLRPSEDIGEGCVLPLPDEEPSA
jgi:hypothetical protein